MNGKVVSRRQSQPESKGIRDLLLEFSNVELAVADALLPKSRLRTQEIERLLGRVQRVGVEEYEFLIRLGGGIGDVFKVRHCLSQAQKVIKIVPIDNLEPAQVQKIIGLQSKRISHPHIAKYEAVSTVLGYPCLFMEYIQRDGSPVTYEHLEPKLFQQYSSAVRFCCGHGIQRGDEKDSFIVCRDHNDERTVNFIDFAYSSANG